MTEAKTPQPTSRLYALVPCAGVGARAARGGPKQYAALGAGSVVAHTLAALAGVRRLHQVLVVLSPGDTQFGKQAPAFTGWLAHCGGATRAETVRAGLDELAARGATAGDWVVVHDAARCLLRPEWVDRLIDACVGDAVGGLLALPVADTLKREASTDVAPRAAPRAAATVSRVAMWQAQTPQMFRLGLLREALAAASVAGVAVTDEASAIEALGLAPRLVRGELENFKLTYPADFALAERLMAAP